jgi:hypothetical protein
MYLIGARWDWRVYRIPAVMCGTIAVALAAAVARRHGRTAAVVACVFACSSHFLIHYSSEARGYAAAMMFALSCVWLMQNYLTTRERSYSVTFAACAILGALSHLTFVFVFIGLLAWSVAELAADGSLTRAAKLRHLVRLHVVPAAFLAVFYAIAISRMRPAGGPVFPVWHVVVETIAYALGGPGSGAGTWIVAAAGAAMLIAEFVSMVRAGERESVLYVTGIILAPAAVLILWRQPYLYPRYFVLCAPLVYLVLARMCGRLWDHGGAARGACVALVVLFMFGNALRLAGFFAGGGRGRYLEAMRFMIDESRGMPTTVGSLQDSRNALMFQFYRKYLPASPELLYVTAAKSKAVPPTWLIIEGGSGVMERVPEAYSTIDGTRYRFVKRFPHSGFSGFDWYVMRIEPGAP